MALERSRGGVLACCQNFWHVWPIASEKMALTAHVRIANLFDWPGILLGLTEIAEHEGIQHVTFQAELHSDEPQGIHFSRSGRCDLR